MLQAVLYTLQIQIYEKNTVRIIKIIFKKNKRFGHRFKNIYIKKSEKNEISRKKYKLILSTSAP